MQSDYEVLAKIIANRLKTNLQELISTDQTGLVKGRNIADNLRKFLDVIDMAEMEKLPLLIISVDFQKAFNRVEYSTLFKVMEWFDFGKKLIQ